MTRKMNSILISTNDGKYYRIAVRANKPWNNIEIAWDSIQNAASCGETWIGFSEADGFEINEITNASSISKVMLNLDNISSIELYIVEDAPMFTSDYDREPIENTEDKKD